MVDCEYLVCPKLYTATESLLKEIVVDNDAQAHTFKECHIGTDSGIASNDAQFPTIQSDNAVC